MMIIEALTLLNQLIDKGIEYPEAEYRVAIELKLNGSQITKPRQLYDQQG
jgi:hypothetical protein